MDTVRLAPAHILHSRSSWGSKRRRGTELPPRAGPGVQRSRPLPVCLLPGPEECSFLSQPDPEDPTGRKSPGLARVGQSGFRPWGGRSLAVWPRASDFASLSPFPHGGEWG